jgi:hypothetical protein
VLLRDMEGGLNAGATSSAATAGWVDDGSAAPATSSTAPAIEGGSAATAASTV